jgi:hypothetical protein
LELERASVSDGVRAIADSVQQLVRVIEDFAAADFNARCTR